MAKVGHAIEMDPFGERAELKPGVKGASMRRARAAPAAHVLRLTVVDAESAAIVVPAALAGFVVSPLWHARLGLTLRRAATAPERA